MKKQGAHLKAGTGRKTQTAITAQEEAFCQHYVSLFPVDNATEAARRARYSAKTAKAAANHLMKKPKIKERIRQLMAPVLAQAEKMHNRTQLTNQRLLEEAMAIASHDLRSMIKVEGGHLTIMDSALWPDEAAMALESIAATQFGLKVKFASKLDAIKLLMTYQKMIGSDTPPPGGDTNINVYQYHLPAKRPLELATVVTPAPEGASRLALHLPPKEPNGYPAPASPSVTRHPVVLDDDSDADPNNPDAELQ
jgi:hypothetical protein